MKKEPTFAEASALRAAPYTRLAQYYETDQMKIIHHANYVRWMEEARVDLMEQIGFGYEKMESMGVYCPVLGVSVDYKGMVRFNERVSIELRIADYTGVTLTFLYRITRLSDGSVCTLGRTRHGFLDAEGHVLSLKRSYPDVHRLILDAIIPNGEGQDV